LGGKWGNRAKPGEKMPFSPNMTRKPSDGKVAKKKEILLRPESPRERGKKKPTIKTSVAGKKGKKGSEEGVGKGEGPCGNKKKGLFRCLGEKKNEQNRAQNGHGALKIL